MGGGSASHWSRYLFWGNYTHFLVYTASSLVEQTTPVALEIFDEFASVTWVFINICLTFAGPTKMNNTYQSCFLVNKYIVLMLLLIVVVWFESLNIFESIFRGSMCRLFTCFWCFIVYFFLAWGLYCLQMYVHFVAIIVNMFHINKWFYRKGLWLASMTVWTHLASCQCFFSCCFQVFFHPHPISCHSQVSNISFVDLDLDLQQLLVFDDGGWPDLQP